MVRTACLVCFISTVNDSNEKKKPIKTSASSGHLTYLEQSIVETFNIYVSDGERKFYNLGPRCITWKCAIAESGSAK